MKTLKNLKPRILLTALSLVCTVAVADTYYWCQNEQTCGTNQKAESSNGCLAITCPVSQVCQGKESRSGNSCSMSAYMAQCTGTQYPEDPFGTLGCGLPGMSAGPEPGGRACEQCSIN
jgi:hypothetical protein